MHPIEREPQIQMNEKLSDRIRKKIADASAEHSEEYLSLMPKKDVPEPDPDTDKEQFSNGRRDYESALDSINSAVETALEYHDNTTLDETLDSLNRNMNRISNPVSNKGIGSTFRKLLRKLVMAGIRSEMDLMRQSISDITRSLNQMNHKNRIFAGKQEALNSEFAVFGQKIIPVIDEKIRYGIEQNSRYLKDRMDIFHEGTDRRQTEIANWLHNANSVFQSCLNRVDDLENELKRSIALHHRKLEHALTQLPDQKLQKPMDSTSPNLAISAPAGGDYAYYLFENKSRGPEQTIRENQADYIQYFREVTPVLDIGCGRGEFLELLRTANIAAKGVDPNEDMIQICREKGLDVGSDDGLHYLQSCEPGTVGGIFSGQVIEHIPAVAIHQWLQSAFRALKPGGVLVFETVNTASPYALINHYYKDPTHRQPLHPDTYRFFTEIAGFEKVTMRFRSPVPVADRPANPTMNAQRKSDEISEFLKTMSISLEQLCDFIYAPCDVLIYARKPENSQ